MDYKFNIENKHISNGRSNNSINNDSDISKLLENNKFKKPLTQYYDSKPEENSNYIKNIIDTDITSKSVFTNNKRYNNDTKAEIVDNDYNISIKNKLQRTVQKKGKENSSRSIHRIKSNVSENNINMSHKELKDSNNKEIKSILIPNYQLNLVKKVISNSTITDESNNQRINNIKEEIRKELLIKSSENIYFLNLFNELFSLATVITPVFGGILIYIAKARSCLIVFITLMTVGQFSFAFGYSISSFFLIIFGRSLILFCFESFFVSSIILVKGKVHLNDLLTTIYIFCFFTHISLAFECFNLNMFLNDINNYNWVNFCLLTISLIICLFIAFIDWREDLLLSIYNITNINYFSDFYNKETDMIMEICEVNNNEDDNCTNKPDNMNKTNTSNNVNKTNEVISKIFDLKENNNPLTFNIIKTKLLNINSINTYIEFTIFFFLYSINFFQALQSFLFIKNIYSDYIVGIFYSVFTLSFLIVGHVLNKIKIFEYDNLKSVTLLSLGCLAFIISLVILYLGCLKELVILVGGISYSIITLIYFYTLVKDLEIDFAPLILGVCFGVKNLIKLIDEQISKSSSRIRASEDFLFIIGKMSGLIIIFVALFYNSKRLKNFIDNK